MSRLPAEAKQGDAGEAVGERRPANRVHAMRCYKYRNLTRSNKFEPAHFIVVN